MVGILGPWGRAGMLAATCSLATVSAREAGAEEAPEPPAAEPAATCEDGIRNGSETDVDCGGDCPLCEHSQLCRRSADCVGGLCLRGVCGSASCQDGVLNQDETDVDCGGAVCSPCPRREVCSVDLDCATGICRPSINSPGFGGRCVASGAPVVQPSPEPVDDADLGVENEAEEAAPEKAERDWYGGWLIPVYIATPVLVLSFADAEGAGTLLVAAWFAPPIVHWAHGETVRGFGSLVMQPVSLISGAIVGAFTAAGLGCGRGSSSCTGMGGATGAALGYLTWAVLDIALLAHRDVPPPKPRTSLLPVVTPLPDGGVLAGWAGAF